MQWTVGGLFTRRWRWHVFAVLGQIFIYQLVDLWTFMRYWCHGSHAVSGWSQSVGSLARSWEFAVNSRFSNQLRFAVHRVLLHYIMILENVSHFRLKMPFHSYQMNEWWQRIVLLIVINNSINQFDFIKIANVTFKCNNYIVFR